MAFSVSSSTSTDDVNIVNDERFVQIYTPDDNAVQLLNNGRTVKNITYFLYACALGIQSYSSGIHRIRIRIDTGFPFIGIRSRNIPPVADQECAGRYDNAPSTYGWGRDFDHIINGRYSRRGSVYVNRIGHVYSFTINCDQRRLSILDENTGEQDEVEVDICYAPFPWCLCINLPRILGGVSLI